MSKQPDPDRFSTLTYEKFKELAADSSLSRYEKIGFPDSYRAGHEAAIFSDILTKLPRLNDRGATVVDIGAGCSELPDMVIAHCAAQAARLIMVDSAEMLALLPDADMTKVAGMFPANNGAIRAAAPQGVDVVICYSVLHYVFVDSIFWDFIDSAVALLNPGGQMLIGDIPNVSMRKRFFASETGIAFHKDFMKTDTPPEVDFNRVEAGKIDDSVVLGLLARIRAAGAHAFVVPQPATLPMANRREDIVVYKP